MFESKKKTSRSPNHDLVIGDLSFTSNYRERKSNGRKITYYSAYLKLNILPDQKNTKEILKTID